MPPESIAATGSTSHSRAAAQMRQHLTAASFDAPDISEVTVSAPRFEHHPTGLGLGTQTPRISFLVSAPPGWQQKAYELQLRTSDEPAQAASTGQVESSESVLVPWPFPELESRSRVEVRARVWSHGPISAPKAGSTSEPVGDDRTGQRHCSEWSSWAAAEAGLLSGSDWQAKAIRAGRETSDTAAGVPSPSAAEGNRPVQLRRPFQLDGPVRSARLYITAEGLYEAELNGARIGDDALTPGWTSYHHRLRYYCYDVTDLVRSGENVIGAWLADGWYCGRLGFLGGRSHNYGSTPALLAQLEITLADGSTSMVVTDDSWTSSTGPLLSSSLYDGETFDARLEGADFTTPATDSSSRWHQVSSTDTDLARLFAAEGPPVRCTQVVRPQAAWHSPTGALLLDFGQNLVGRLRIRVAGDAGHTVTLRHAEILQDGELCTRPLRDAAATDTYILAGSGDETWEPRFTFHGFRYAEITGWTGGDPLSCVEARVYHTDMTPAGAFECSETQVNRLHENVVWSMRGNFVDIPTDCPQRDERLGWTGDIQVFAPTAAFLYDCTAMLSSWLSDVAAEQTPDGVIPWYVPFLPTTDQWTPPRAGAVWGDVIVLTPLDLFHASGDVDLLTRFYPAAKTWVDLIAREAGSDRIWDTPVQLGDWLDPAAPPDDPAAGVTDRALVATAYFAHSADRLAGIAKTLDHHDDAAHYADLADQVRVAFRRRYADSGGRLTNHTQTAYALAIAFHLLDDDQTARAGGHLADLVDAADGTIATGFAGTPLVAPALDRSDQLESAYRLLLQTQCPSWLYTVAQGGTTIWERWDSLLPNGQVNPGEMTSFNHYALGAIADWLHSSVAGLGPGTDPGYRTIRVAPRPGDGLTHAAAAHRTPYGIAAVRWDHEPDGTTTYRVRVPTGTTAELHLPDEKPTTLPSGTHRLNRPTRSSERPDGTLPTSAHSSAPQAPAPAGAVTEENPR